MGRALRLFVPSGLPAGLRIVEKSNWSGSGFVVPRSHAAVMLLACTANGLTESKDASGLTGRFPEAQYSVMTRTSGSA